MAFLGGVLNVLGRLKVGFANAEADYFNALAVSSRAFLVMASVCDSDNALMRSDRRESVVVADMVIKLSPPKLRISQTNNQQTEKRNRTGRRN
jgi:hypothetical protein